MNRYIRHYLSIFILIIPIVINVWFSPSFEYMVAVTGICGFISALIHPLQEQINDIEEEKFSEETEAIAKEFMKLANWPFLQEETKTVLNCVNCGAPIKSNYCEYCGTVYKNE